MPRRRVRRSAEEVSSLLSLVQESGETALLLASTSRPNEDLWLEISRRLAATGYRRAVAQCRSKWKALKSAFYSEEESCRRAGQHSSRVPPRYQAMKSIWKAAGRPVFGERKMLVAAKLRSRRRRSALATRSSSSPEPSEHSVGGHASSMPVSPMVVDAVERPENYTSCYVAPLSVLDCHTDLRQEGAEGKASFPGETSLGMGRGELPLAAAATGSHGTAAVSEQPAASEDASDTSLYGPFVAAVFQKIRRAAGAFRQMVGLLRRSTRHYQASLETVEKSLEEILPQLQTLPGPLGHYVRHVPF